MPHLTDVDVEIANPGAQARLREQRKGGRHYNRQAQLAAIRLLVRAVPGLNYRTLFNRVRVMGFTRSFSTFGNRLAELVASRGIEKQGKGHDARYFPLTIVVDPATLDRTAEIRFDQDLAGGNVLFAKMKPRLLSRTAGLLSEEETRHLAAWFTRHCAELGAWVASEKAYGTQDDARLTELKRCSAWLGLLRTYSADETRAGTNRGLTLEGNSMWEISKDALPTLGRLLDACEIPGPAGRPGAAMSPSTP